MFNQKHCKIQTRNCTRPNVKQLEASLLFKKLAPRWKPKIALREEKMTSYNTENEGAQSGDFGAEPNRRTVFSEAIKLRFTASPSWKSIKREVGTQMTRQPKKFYGFPRLCTFFSWANTRADKPNGRSMYKFFQMEKED